MPRPTRNSAWVVVPRWTIQTDPATTMEAYLAVRSSVMRLLDPAATGRFRVMAFGRGWPDAPGGLDARPLAGFAYRVRWR